MRESAITKYLCIEQRSRGLSQHIADLGANILQIGQSRGFGRIAIEQTEVELVVETAGLDHVERNRRELSKEGFQLRSEP